MELNLRKFIFITTAIILLFVQVYCSYISRQQKSSVEDTLKLKNFVNSDRRNTSLYFVSTGMIFELLTTTRGFKKCSTKKTKIECKSCTRIVRIRSEGTCTVGCMNCYTRDLQSGSYRREELMMHECARLMSFNSFPGELKYSALKLASLGFYYTGNGTVIKCFCCGVCLNALPEGTSVLDYHRQRSPNCKFVTGTDNSNIPFSHSNIPTGGSSFPDPYLYGLNDRQKLHRYPEFASLEARRRTFQNNTVSSLNPEEFTDAGLFYTGETDLVRCYSCGIGLHDWSAEDDPWIEHARHSSNCRHVLYCKGEEFVDTVKRAHSEDSAPDDLTNSSFESDVQSAAAKACILLGYKQNEVRGAVTYLREQSGSRCRSLSALLKILRNNRTSSQEQSQNLQNLSCQTQERGSTVDLTNLYQSVENLRHKIEKLTQETRCKVCLDKKANIVFEPCNHLSCCEECAQRLTKCAVCRQEIRSCKKVFLS